MTICESAEQVTAASVLVIMTRLFTGAAILLVGCCVPDKSEIVHVETMPCEFVFSPVPELLDATVAQAARWSTATGCDIRVACTKFEPEPALSTINTP